MSENVITDDEALNSEFAPHKIKAGRSPKGIVGRLIIILTITIAISMVTLFGYRFFSKKPNQSQPSTSVREIVDANSSTSDPQSSVGTLQEELPESPVTLEAPQSRQPEFTVDSRLMELLNEIPYEQRQTRDALVYFDDRIESLIALQPNLESMISIQEKTSDSLEIRMMAVEAALREIREVIDTDNNDDTELGESRPPFRLIAIDRWENQWNAVIELDGRITMIQPQESRAGWKLLKIIPSRASAVFRSNSGAQTALKVN